MTDVIADMLTRIRNALMAKHETVEIPASNTKKAIADILLKEGYIEGVEILAVKIVLSNAHGVAEALIVNDLAGAEELYDLAHVGIVVEPKDVIVCHASLLLCYYHIFAMFLAFQKMRKILIFQGVSALLKLTIFQKFQ